jgi:hypothetical protein
MPSRNVTTWVFAVVCIVAGAPLSSAFSQTPKLTGTIYLRMESGDVRRLAATPVSILDRAETERGIAALCEHLTVGLTDSITAFNAREKALRDSAERVRGRTERARLHAHADSLPLVRNQVVSRIEDALIVEIERALLTAVASKASADVDGRFTIAGWDASSGVLLFVSTSVAEHTYTWLLELSTDQVFAGSEIELNNTNVLDETAGFAACNWYLTSKSNPQ